MFSIDFPEIIIILGVALVVLGPKKLPVVAAKIGRWVGRARTMARQFREQLEQEISSAESAADIRKSVDSVAEAARSEPAAHPPGPRYEASSDAVPPESVPREGEGVAGAASAHDPVPHEPPPHESAPPAESYGPPPQQLSFDSQLHDTALPPAQGPTSAHADDMRAWMPETQTWMASTGWDSTEAGRAERAASRAAPQSASPHGPASESGPGSGSGSGSGSEPARTEAVEHGDR